MTAENQQRKPVELYKASALDYRNVPQELLHPAHPAWLLWAYKRLQGDSKPRKMPYYTSGKIRMNGHGSADDLRNLDTFDNALDQFTKHSASYSGLGLAIRPDNHIIAIDLDHCLDDEGNFKEISSTQRDAYDVAVAHGAYIEVSPSGRGLRIFWIADGKIAQVNVKSHAHGYEMFVSNGFVTVTGRKHTVSGDRIPLLSFSAKGIVRDRSTPIARPETQHAHSAAEQQALEEELTNLLSYIPADVNYDDWLRVGAGLYHTSNGYAWGRSLFDTWSAGKPDAPAVKYPGAEAIEKKWDSFGRASTGNAPRASIVTIRAIAAEHGWDGGFIAALDSLDNSEQDITQRALWRPQKELSVSRAVAQLAPMRNEKSGKINATPKAIQLFLQTPGLSGYRLAHDSFKDEMVMQTVTEWGETGAWERLDDAGVGLLMIAMDVAGFNNITAHALRNQLAVISKDNRFDSAREWATTLKWDGVKRVDNFLVTHFGCEVDIDSGYLWDYTQQVSRYMWTALAARAVEAGAKADMVVVFVGAQGVRKTTGIQALAPSSSEYASIDLSQLGADAYRTMRGRFAIELPELSGLSKQDLEKVKAFITQAEETWTPKYKEFSTSYKRRCVFFGSTNEDAFLFDETGNRRWLPVRVTGNVDAARIKDDRSQLWAEALHIYKRDGVAWQVSDTEAAAIMREQFTIHDPASSLLRKYIGDNPDDMYSASELLGNAMGLPAERQNNRNLLVKVGRIMRELGYESTRIGKEQQRVYIKKPVDGINKDS